MSEEFISQFGETLLQSSSSSAPDERKSVSPSTGLTGKDYILLYFSAKWCPPCRKFTPVLIDFYDRLHTELNFEVVFCSLDNEEGQYKDYCSKMPWLCMPFEAKETKSMARKYEAQGIPHLVVVDGRSGEIITLDGTAGLRSDEAGSNFPWKPKSFGQVWPDKLLSNKQTQEEFLNSEDIKDKYLMLYFSAHWCPPCKMFTPKLSEAYTKLKAQRDDFELVFVSSDKDEETFKEYFASMTFCALPYEHRDEKAALSKIFSVRGIPTLVMLGPVSDEEGNRPLINSNIRSFIENEEFGEFPFEKKNYGSLDNATADINDMKTVILFHEYGDDDEQDQIKTLAMEVAEKIKVDESKDTVNVLWALDPKGLAARVRSFVGLPDMSEEAVMVMLDIPDEGAYYKSDVKDLTVDSVMEFIEKPGDRSQLK